MAPLEIGKNGEKKVCFVLESSPMDTETTEKVDDADMENDDDDGEQKPKSDSWEDQVSILH